MIKSHVLQPTPYNGRRYQRQSQSPGVFHCFPSTDSRLPGLCHHPLHKAGAYTKLAAHLQHPHAALVELLDALVPGGGAHAPAFLIRASGAILAVTTAKLDAIGSGSGDAGIDAIADHAALELSEYTAHLEHRTA